MRKKLRIAFIARSTLYSSPGGDTIQMEKTAYYLNRLGWEVQVFTTNDQINYDEFDLFQYFNLTRPADILYHIAQTDKPFFLAPIFLDLQEFEHKARSGSVARITKKLPGSFIEYLKCIARYVRNGEQIRSWYYLFNGHTASMRRILQKCTAVFPNSYSEYHRIEHKFKYKGAYDIVPCGVDMEIFNQDSNIVRQSKLILCVGRIETRKNQLSLIRALQGTDFELVIIGNPSPNHKQYYERCKIEAKGMVTFIENIDQKDLIEYYYKAKVHVLPSWFETVGLSSLEAACCGCNIVVSDKGDVKEYFKDDAWYCDPEDMQSILSAVTKAAESPLNESLQQQVRTKYSWSKVAEIMDDLYAKYLKS